MRLLGVTDSYLRQTAAAMPGLTEPGQSCRSYSLNDLAQLRQIMEARSRTPGKFVPVRRNGEHLQCIAVVNFKGGSAKTTTAVNLSQYLALHGYRTLAIDLDPQANSYDAVRRRPGGVGRTGRQVFMERFGTKASARRSPRLSGARTFQTSISFRPVSS